MSERAQSGLTRLKLTDFRSYSSLDLMFAGTMAAFVGANGIGKTNILEAISFLTAGRGLRRALLSDVARTDGSGGWSVSASLLRDGHETRLGTGLNPRDTGRRIRIDGEDAKTSDVLLDYVRILWLVPSMDGLFTGAAGDRRRFLDRLTLSLDPLHGRRVGDFEKALRHRNRLLEQRGDASVLNAIETQVAELGTAVSMARGETVSLLGETIAAQANNATIFPVADLALEGAFESEGLGLGASDREDQYREHLREGRGRDRAAGRTLTGPHLSDLKVRHLAKNMPASKSSTGEQKALLIGLVLAHAELTKQVSGIVPTLLLDEVAAHLDPDRRRALFGRLQSIGGQVFMTGTDISLFEALPNTGEIFTITSDGARKEHIK